MKLIPSIDLQNGQCVRLRQGKFNQTTIYPTNALSLVRNYIKKGVKHLHIVDLDGAISGDIQQLELIKTLQSDDITLQVGGGIRNMEGAKKCIESGINKLVLGSIAISLPQLAEEIIQYAGNDAIVLALDVNISDNKIPKLAIHGWQTSTEASLWDVVNYYQDIGVKDILCTDIASDGMMNGPNFILYQEALKRFPNLSWQASGGIRHQQDIDALKRVGLSAAVVGRALYEGDFKFKQT